MTCSSDYVPVKTQIGHGHKSMVICGCRVVCQVIFLQRVKGMRHVMNITLKVLVHLCNYAHVSSIRCKVPHPASSCNLFNQRSIQPRFNYGQNRSAGNHSITVTDPSTGARPPRPSFCNFRPPRQPGNIRPFRQGARPQTRFVGICKKPY